MRKRRERVKKYEDKNTKIILITSEFTKRPNYNPNTMSLKHPVTFILAILAICVLSSQGFAPTLTNINARTSHTSLFMAKGRKSLRKTIAASNGSNARGVTPMAGEMPSSPSSNKRTNWVPVKGISSMKDLPQEENVVKLVDTKADQLINSATNPTGAVSIVNYDSKTYCFSSSCPSCKIPLSKAKVFPPNEETGNTVPRLSCDFCKATYNIRSGERVENAEKPGLFGGVVSGLFSAQESVALPTYDLGEKSGQVLINLP